MTTAARCSPARPARPSPCTRGASALAASAFLAAAACGGGGPPDAGRDAGRDAGQDSGRYRRPDAGPWFPDMPVRIAFDPDVRCTAPPEPRNGFAPEPAPGETPRLAWTVRPFQDPVAVPVLLASGFSNGYIANLPFTEMPDGDVIFLLKHIAFMALDRDGRFDGLQFAGSEMDPAMLPAIAAGGDWALYRYVKGVVAVDMPVTPTPTSGGVLNLFDGGIDWPEEALEVTPVAVTTDGRTVVPSGGDWLVGSCALDTAVRWVIRYDVSGVDPRYRQYTRRRLAVADDDTIFFYDGEGAIYRFSADGELLGTTLGAAGAPESRRRILGYIPGCGLYVEAEGHTVEIWTRELELTARWEDVEVQEDRGLEISPTADCGAAYHVRRYHHPEGFFIGVVKLDARGEIQWERETGDWLHGRPIPVEGGGTLSLRQDERSLWLLHLSAEGEERMNLEVPAPGAVMTVTPVLGRHGRLYFGMDRAAGLAFYVAAVDTGLRPLAMAGDQYSPNPRHTSAAVWR